jgi:hypothetical protein
MKRPVALTQELFCPLESLHITTCCILLHVVSTLQQVPEQITSVPLLGILISEPNQRVSIKSEIEDRPEG